MGDNFFKAVKTACRYWPITCCAVVIFAYSMHNVPIYRELSIKTGAALNYLTGTNFAGCLSPERNEIAAETARLRAASQH